MHFANFTYAHSVCSTLHSGIENDSNARKIVRFPYLEAGIFSNISILPHTEGYVFRAIWLFPGAEAYAFCVLLNLPHAEAPIFCKIWPLRGAEANVFLKIWPLRSAEALIFYKIWSFPHLLKVPLLLVFWQFLCIAGLLFEKNSSGIRYLYINHSPGIIPKWDNPRD